MTKDSTSGKPTYVNPMCGYFRPHAGGKPCVACWRDHADIDRAVAATLSTS